ncbi:hypothetical protein ARMGADRAFT_1093132 [Armillaria gallica]|uniref:Uncharacterized protein n=1 Tax=Armillaria gallica TaxID=47427 RepID=A0A2H3CVT7_ARMGA|nr:hypothetical protein ARMGADRAFT_1093132 [Armillaria gallica]
MPCAATALTPITTTRTRCAGLRVDTRLDIHAHALGQTFIYSHKEAQDLVLGFRCVVSGNYDQDTLSEVSTSNGSRRSVHTLRQSPRISHNENSSNEESVRFNIGILAVLKSLDHAIEQLNDINVHFLPGIITMQSDAHEWLLVPA